MGVTVEGRSRKGLVPKQSVTEMLEILMRHSNAEAVLTVFGNVFPDVEVLASIPEDTFTSAEQKVLDRILKDIGLLASRR